MGAFGGWTAAADACESDEPRADADGDIDANADAEANTDAGANTDADAMTDASADAVADAGASRGARVLRTMLAPAIAVRARTDDVDPDAHLLADELPAVARAVPSRRAEFATVRTCARDALADLGVPDAQRIAIVPGPDRAPRWPEGVVGALTHCAGFRAAAVARRGRIAAVGIDAEPALPLPDGVLELVATAGDRERLAALEARRGDVPWGRVLFSAKESVYKAWSPLARTWLGFEECELTIALEADVPGDHLAGGAFEAMSTVPPPPQAAALARLRGRWAVADDLVLTAVVVPGPHAPRPHAARP